ncbi:hypothetical protein [Brevibacillus parabrevis]|jgi:hypothetical protein|uniref:hypothetical protein n=1 Tax=Brevibacillus parabrevis TaxID=54914 RepID=UPI001C22D04C|nr:hypothetical protein [Brevibacillus parabrevis]MBU8713670.1 hypothetical protein [Brevibacillus parabrevis]MED2256166.1 hypothetical protein [Brevibacillus parabrevis]WDV94963.1 hypothetical protein PSE45_25560 [Brevibacillus parabrevis]
MQVIIGDNTFQCENSKQGIASLLNQIEAVKTESNLIFNHVTVDGTDIYDNIEEYLFANFNSIHSITVHLFSKEMLKNDIINSIHEYVVRAMPEIEKLSNDMYTGLSTELWGRFGQLVEGIQWLSQTGSFFSNEAGHQEGSEVDHSLFIFDREMEQFEEALEQQDNVLLADIMQYEVVPRFEKIAEHLHDFVNKEVTTNDLN